MSHAVILVIIPAALAVFVVVASLGERKPKPTLCLLCEGIDPTAACECVHGCGAIACQAYASRGAGR